MEIPQIDEGTLSAASLATDQTRQVINRGISQTFDYGIAMTVLVLFLIFVIALCIWLLRNFLIYVKDSNKLAADMYAVCNTMAQKLDMVTSQYNQLLIYLKVKEKE